MRRFLLSLVFIGLVLLAFNSYIIFKTQNSPSLAPETEADFVSEKTERTLKNLPDTTQPNPENLPRLKGYETIAKNDKWIGDVPCDEDIYDAPLSLPGLGPRKNGPFLIDPIKTKYGRKIINQRTSLYKSKNGITLKYVQPVIEYYDVSGRRYRDAKKDLFDRKPIETLKLERISSSRNIPNRKSPDGKKRITTVGNILSPSRLSYTITGSRDRYRLVVNKTVLTSSFYVMLPRWENYEAASDADKEKWDDFVCKTTHHELGHLRIRLDIFSETLDGYSALPPAQSHKEMEQLIKDYRKDIRARIDDRQKAYHIYNNGGVRRGMTELPYADLPFPWL